MRTPLYDFHKTHNARIVDFAGWDMPVQYRSIIEEHKATRAAATLFDVCHMGEVDIQGPDALAYLDHLLTNDITKLHPGRILYSPMCQPDGGTIDDLLVYQRAENDYLLCINAGNTAKDLAHLRQVAANYKNLTLTDRSPETGLLAIQGPRAAAILQTLTTTDLATIAYYHFTTGQVADIPCLISRTGYTGEDGFELYHPADKAPQLAEKLLAAGQPHGLELAGLGARDSLRLEAGFPLYGHELNTDISPIAAGIAWTVKLNKSSDFIGRAALEKEKQNGPLKKVLYFKTNDRRIPRPETKIYTTTQNPDGTLSPAAEAGRVLSGTLSPILNEAICSGLIDAQDAAAPLAVDIRGTLIPLQPVKPPFIQLKKS